MMGPRLVPPAGYSMNWRITGQSLVRPAVAWEESWSDLLGAGERFFFSSGRGALAFLLEILRDTGWANARVIMPGYTCFSVAAAAARARFRIRLCDLSPDSLALDAEQVRRWCRTGRHIVIAASLLGVPCNVKELEAICRETGSFLIDDAAQTMGALPAGQPAGSFGDAGLFSTGRGKIISGFHGGILTLRSPGLSGQARDRYDRLRPQAVVACLGALDLFLMSPLLQHPRVFWLPARIPALGIGRTEFDPGFPVRRLRRMSIRVLGAVTPDVRSANLARRRRAAAWRERLAGLPLRFLGAESAVYPRLGIRLPDAAARGQAVAAARRAGVMAAPMYPSVVADIPAVRDLLEGDVALPGSRQLCDTLVTLPTHRHVTDRDMRRVGEAWSKLL
jgi:dTDP-4-amino-4,6-dideoxygalactose transaminase